jgi:hypothetical protein
MRGIAKHRREDEKGYGLSCAVSVSWSEDVRRAGLERRTDSEKNAL